MGHRVQGLYKLPLESKLVFRKFLFLNFLSLYLYLQVGVKSIKNIEWLETHLSASLFKNDHSLASQVIIYLNKVGKSVTHFLSFFFFFAEEQLFPIKFADGIFCFYTPVKHKRSTLFSFICLQKVMVNLHKKAVNVENLEYILFNTSCCTAFLLVVNADCFVMDARCASLLKG